MLFSVRPLLLLGLPEFLKSQSAECSSGSKENPQTSL